MPKVLALLATRAEALILGVLCGLCHSVFIHSERTTPAGAARERVGVCCPVCNLVECPWDGWHAQKTCTDVRAV